MMNLIYYRHSFDKRIGVMPKNTISFDELTMVFKGELNYTVNGQPVCVQSGDIIYIKNGSERSRLPILNANYVSLNFICEQALDLPLLIKNGLSDAIFNIISAFDNIFNYTIDLSDQRFNLLLCFIVKQLEKQCKSQLEPPLVYKIKQYIRLNLSNKITLENVSDYTHYSAVHCEMVFKKSTGLSIMAYVIKKRIEMAKSLLLEGTLSLPEIADAVGFLDYNYFSRTFKKQVGKSPLAYKNSFWA